RARRVFRGGAWWAGLLRGGLHRDGGQFHGALPGVPVPAGAQGSARAGGRGVSRERASRLAAGLSATGLLAGTFLLPPGKPLPFDLCLLHRLTGIPCLTCGLTRAVCLLARGEWRASLSMHPAGGLAF